MFPVRVLVSDDQADVGEALRLLLKGAGYQTRAVLSAQALLDAAQDQEYDLILMDLNYTRDTTSGEEGLDLLKRLQAQGSRAPVIVMTAWGTVDLAVEAMRRGASDFVLKPWDNERLLTTLGKLEAEAMRRRHSRSEMEIARHVQQTLFPQKRVTMQTLDYRGCCLPAREVGGDYYDFFDLGEGHFAFVLADVSGKGVAAALLMANLQALFRSQSEWTMRYPSSLLQAVNGLFCASTPPEYYATLVFGHYDDCTRRLEYVNCGHPAPILLRRDGRIEPLESTATVLGLFHRWTCESRMVDLAPGDTLAVFSDGLIEAGVETGQEFGVARLVQLMRDHASEPIERVVRRLAAAPQDRHEDDLTIIGLRGR
jgi:sigma-B regulation protein RsbU (phosphoserine phosphatase)